MVAVAVVGALVQRVSELVDGGPFPDAVVLVSTHAPVYPFIALVHVVVRHRQVGRIEGEVGVVAVRHLFRGVAVQTPHHTGIARCAHDPLRLVAVASRPVEIGRVLTGRPGLSGVPERGSVKRIEVVGRGCRPRVRGVVGDVEFWPDGKVARFTARELNATCNASVEVLGLENHVEARLPACKGLLKQGSDVETHRPRCVDPLGCVERCVGIGRAVGTGAEPRGVVPRWVRPGGGFGPSRAHGRDGNQSVLRHSDGVEVQDGVGHLIGARKREIGQIDFNEGGRAEGSVAGREPASSNVERSVASKVRVGVAAVEVGVLRHRRVGKARNERPFLNDNVGGVPVHLVAHVVGQVETRRC